MMRIASSTRSFSSSGKARIKKLVLETVSTTCDSGWVRSRAASPHSPRIDQCCGHLCIESTELLAHPPAIAGGTDCLQH